MIDTSKTEKPKTEKPKTEKPKTLRPNRLKGAAHVRNVYHVEPAVDDEAEDLLKREYWLHFASQLRAGDKVEMLWESGTQYAEAVVLDADGKGATVAFTIKPMGLTEKAAITDNLGYFPKWRGPHSKWSVLRASDDEVMIEQLSSKPEALRYISETLRAA